ncbi:MFS transporter [uncultured Maribacter sp.]|uniref:MFS transporter n=1 Tax=uncultured Maribacter sp. TaxID=431308 RepID=UPI002639A077|nr:MFS transporter [uncultured Maribacter sp.]
MNSLKLIFSNPKYFGAAWVFSSINILFGTWAIYIPTVKEKLKIDNGELGFAIFFLSLGVFTVFPIASLIINKIGVGKATWYGILVSGLTAILPFLAPSYFTLMLSLFLFGGANGFTDISMNTLVAELEKKNDAKFMSASHGFFSLGGVLAGLGSFLIGPLGNPVLHMGIAIILVVVVNAIFYRYYRNTKADLQEKGSFSLKLFKPLILLALISFISMASEGAIIDWSGIYLNEIAMAPEALWGLGFLGFQITMTLGRFLGDTVSSRIGPIKIVLLGAILAIIGYALVLTANTYLAIFGFAVCGLGFSVMVPETFRIGANVPGVDISKSVSFIAGSGYAGFLCAPPILGFLADKYSLNLSFLVLLLGVITVLPISFLLKKRKS